jgi:hypothetical protein
VFDFTDSAPSSDSVAEQAKGLRKQVGIGLGVHKDSGESGTHGPHVCTQARGFLKEADKTFNVFSCKTTFSAGFI